MAMETDHSVQEFTMTCYSLSPFNRTVAATLIAVGVLPPGLAAGQTKQQLDWCVNRHHIYSWDQQIAGCRAAINSSRLSRQNLAICYSNRAAAYGRKGEDDHDIADATQAIRLYPKLSEAYINRGSGYLGKGDLDRAFTEYNQAIQLDAKSWIGFFNRGNAYMVKGDLDRAIADYGDSIRLNPKFSRAYFRRGIANLYSGLLPEALSDLNQSSAVDRKFAYTAVWLYILSKRSNLPSGLAEATPQLDMKAWPAPVVALYLGQMTLEAVLAAADDRDAHIKKSRVCQANFYACALELHRGAKDKHK